MRLTELSRLLTLSCCLWVTSILCQEEVEEDAFLVDARSSCLANATLGCFSYDAARALDAFLESEIPLGNHVRLVHVSGRQQFIPRSLNGPGGLAGFLERTAARFAASTDVVISFPREAVPRGLEPRFVDEIYSEFQKFNYKDTNANTKSQLQKLFIPLLVILKLFKLKLLFLLPIILGVASFKKLLGLMLILVPGVIGYLKLCRSSYDYGAHGHSSYYKRPPSLERLESISHSSYHHPYSGYYPE